MDGGTQTGTPGAGAPAVGWASGPLGVVQAASREIARATAVRARAVAEFAASRPASADRAQGERGAMSAERWAARAEVLRPISEWATPEVAIALNLTRQGAERLLAESLILVHRLPATLAALEAGVLHAGHLWHLIDKVAPVADDVVRAEVEAELIAWMGRRQTVTSPAQLGDKARRIVAQRDAAAAARRLARALTERGISLRPERAEGMAALTVVCTMPEARALHAALVRYADALADDPDGPDGPEGSEGPVRTRGQKMVDALLDLVLRPGETDLPPVRVLLSVVASVGTLLGGDAPAEVDGELVPAEMARQLVRAFAGLGRVSTPAATDAADPANPTEPADPAAPAESAPAGSGVGVDEPVDASEEDPAGLGAEAGEPVGAPEEEPAGSGGKADEPVNAPDEHPVGPGAEAVPTGPSDWFDDPAWWAEAERRIAAGDFSGAGLPGWSAFLGDAVEPGEPYRSETIHPPDWVTDPVERAEWIAAGQELEWSLDLQPAIPARPPHAGPPPQAASPDADPPPHAAGPPPPDADRPPSDGWWAAADRAVDDAGAAVHAAR
ncbi:DUF222 domain-containing protein, partial [Geodermatophilus sp. DF01_2]|uniref:DUF222 domain-containing protein n=1 Tax=Geodermatophilus sp. DF01-2 TaxID=2559610 RepID=UPI001ADD6362